MVEEEEYLKRALSRNNNNRYSRLDETQLALEEEILLIGLCDKCLESYEELSRDMVEAYNRAIVCLKYNKPESISADHIDQETYQGILKKLYNEFNANTQTIVRFIKSLPGFCHLDIADLTVLLEQQSMCLMWCVTVFLSLFNYYS